MDQWPIEFPFEGGPICTLLAEMGPWQDAAPPGGDNKHLESEYVDSRGRKTNIGISWYSKVQNPSAAQSDLRWFAAESGHTPEDVPCSPPLTGCVSWMENERLIVLALAVGEYAGNKVQCTITATQFYPSESDVAAICKIIQTISFS